MDGTGQGLERHRVYIAGRSGQSVANTNQSHPRRACSDKRSYDRDDGRLSQHENHDLETSGAHGRAEGDFPRANRCTGKKDVRNVHARDQ